MYLFPVCKQDACDGSVGIQEDFFDHCSCPYFTAVFYGLIDRTQDLLGLVCSHVAYRCRNNVQAGLERFGDHLLRKIAARFEQDAARTVLKVYLVGLIDE